MIKINQRDLVGNIYGKLLVVESCGKGKNNHYYSKVKCECGKEYLVPDTELIHGRRKSCLKCSRIKTHGKTNTRLFHIWESMRQRCANVNSSHYKYYGGRGISVCEEWKNSFTKFENWAFENGYSTKLTLDRKDTNGNYEPDNCRWVDFYTQANNKRNNVCYLYKDKMYTIAQLSVISGISYSCLYNRLIKGWDIEKAISVKPIKGRNQYGKI